jgi:hypothetical protein
VSGTSLERCRHRAAVAVKDGLDVLVEVEEDL